MKHSRYLWLIMALYTFATCSKTIAVAYQRTGEVSPIGHERSIIKIQSNSKAANHVTAVNYAERQAIETILFKGIPNSNQEVALIEDESRAWTDNKDVLESLILNGGYLKYIIFSKTVNLANHRGVSFISQNIEIDIAALRKHLVNERVIKQFGL